MKGSSRNIFAMPLGDMAEALEHAARAGDMDFVARNNSAFLEAAETLIGEIEAALDAVAKANPRPRKNAPAPELLLRLREACDNYEFDVIDEIMEEIDSYEYDADNGLAAWLRENALRMDFAAIAARLS